MLDTNTPARSQNYYQRLASLSREFPSTGVAASCRRAAALTLASLTAFKSRALVLCVLLCSDSFS